ncbi:MAG: hypothetical protein ACFB2Z_10885 [Maricaulaceae bacterium]
MGVSLHLACQKTFTPQEFTTLVIEPVLCALSSIPFSKAASQLLIATALHESQGLKHRRQIRGPALSFFQIEPKTHDDIWANFLAYRLKLAKEVESIMTTTNANKIIELEYNDNYAAAIARVHYFRVKESIPKFGDTTSIADYWKKHYNTPLGKGTPSKLKSDWAAYNGGAITFRESCK